MKHRIISPKGSGPTPAKRSGIRFWKAGKGTYGPADRHELSAAFIPCSDPAAEGNRRRKPVEQKWFEDVLKERTGKFGGVTSFVRAIGMGKMLGRSECASVLQQNLDEEKATHSKLNTMALRRVNRKAT